MGLTVLTFWKAMAHSLIAIRSQWRIKGGQTPTLQSKLRGLLIASNELGPQDQSQQLELEDKSSMNSWEEA